MKKVVIGAGPAGLYTAIKLRQQGVRELVIYDPRAGSYTRPGHLNKSVFTTTESGLGISFWPGDKVGHIKDLEKQLYEIALNLNIKIEPKRFICLHQDKQRSGIVVEYEGTQEVVEADYVFDCTGSRRQVINAVNSIISDSPLQLTKITELPVRNHFIAYVKISETDWELFQSHYQFNKNFPDMIDPFYFTQSIHKLRALGWKEFKFPRIYGMEFGKDKVCVYLHAPDGLVQEKYDEWVQTALKCYTPSIRYEKLDLSKKPRFMAFSSKAEALSQVAFKGENLPTVIALGDTQIDFDYVLAHGIEDGIKRINTLFEQMEFDKGEIIYFDPEEYFNAIRPQLREHKDEITEAAEKVRQSFIDALKPAEQAFESVLLSSQSSLERKFLEDTLKEIQGRQSYETAVKEFASCHNPSKQLNQSASDKLVATMERIRFELSKAQTYLPASFEAEHKEIDELLIYLAASWKEVGNAFIKNTDNLQAIKAYKKALEIYNSQDPVKTLPLYSNLVIACMKQKLYADSIDNADYALFILSLCAPEQRPNALQEKIEHNLTSVLCAHAKELLKPSTHDDARDLHSKALRLIDSYKEILSKTSMSSIQAVITELQNYLVPAQDLCHPEAKQDLVVKGCQPDRDLAVCSLANFSTFNKNTAGSVQIRVFPKTNSRI